MVKPGVRRRAIPQHSAASWSRPALGFALGGSKGLIGAGIGVAVVALFFATSVFAVSRAARISPQAMMATAVGTYLVKILLLLVFVGAFQNTTAFSPKAFGLTALCCILVYTGAQVVWSMRLKAPYVEPDGER
jgi:ATP synthase protein I